MLNLQQEINTAQQILVKQVNIDIFASSPEILDQYGNPIWRKKSLIPEGLNKWLLTQQDYQNI